jgi:hypothetical protein
MSFEALAESRTNWLPPPCSAGYYRAYVWTTCLGPKPRTALGPGTSSTFFFYNGRKKASGYFYLNEKRLTLKSLLCTNVVYSDEVIPGPQVLGQGALDGTAYIRKASES